MQTTNSISEISKVIRTSGSNPVVVLTEGIEEFVCKYSTNTPANKLLIEYLGYSFAAIWNIPIPQAKLVNILQEHIPDHILGNGIQRRSFEIPTIGSLNYPESKEMDKTLIASWQARKAQLRKIQNKEDFLKIGLFDLWLSNEDRNHNNFNLLIQPTDRGAQVMAIDHEKCFNSGIIDPNRPIYQLTGDESILTTEIIPLLFRQGIELDTIIDSILDEFPVLVAECQAQMAQLMQHIPPSWGINTERLEEFLNNNIFAQEWIDETSPNFRQYIADSFR